LGGSDAPAAIGVSPWQTPLELWQRKLGLAPEPAQTPAMHFGRVLESFVRREFARTTGMTVRKPRAVFVHQSLPWMFGSLDGTINGSLKRIFEAKTARSRDGWGEPGSSEIPMHYLVQVTHYMAVTGAELCYLAALFAGAPPIATYVIERDREAIEMLTDLEHQFWRHVQEMIPPECQTRSDAAARWRVSADTAIPASTEVLAACRRLANTREEILRLEETEEQQELLIKSFMQEHSTLTHEGKVLATWRSSKNKTVTDWKKVAAEHPDIIRRYQSEQPGNRPFLLKEIA
jgi:putative phage-type endonuclease